MAYISSNAQISGYTLASCLWFFLALGIADAQRMPPLSTHNKKAIKWYEQGAQLLRERKIEGAIDAFERAVRVDSGFSEAYLSIANAYMLTGEKLQAKPYWTLAIAYGKGRSDFHPAYLAMGDICYQQGDYECAGTHYTQYLTMRGARQDLLPEIELRMRNCAFAIKEKEKPHPIQPRMAPDSINAYQYQYFPTLPADGSRMYLTVKQDNTLEDIMVAKRMGEAWSLPISISAQINTPEANEGTCAISGDGRTLVLTACNKKDGMGRCDLYISYKNGDQWSVPENMGGPVNTAYWESQPTLSADGRLLVFVSDKPGGMGKRDLYYSRKGVNGQWSEPRNMGPMINTRKEEVSPFIHANAQSFFFASDGHLGFGGFDIYQTTFADTIRELPVNVGYPINTHQDELSLFVTADGSKAYYSLDVFKPGMRTGGRSYIYELDWPESLTLPRTDLLQGFVYDAESKKPIQAELELVMLNRTLPPLQFSSQSADGSYTVVLTEGNRYGVFVQAKGYLYQSFNFDFSKQRLFDRKTLDIYLQPLKKGSSVVMNNLFFDTDRYELKPESNEELDKVLLLLKQNPSLTIEIGGHTDDVGQDSYNLELSRKRAAAVYERLVTQGAPAKQMTHAGYGKTKPKMPNTSDENRQLNRRIEFVIR
jgi:outer membrane protein OmpA-like peptidoglycan-associated protein